MPAIADEPVAVETVRVQPRVGDLVSMPTDRGLCAFRVVRVNRCELVLRPLRGDEGGWDDVFAMHSDPLVTVLSKELRVDSDPSLGARVRNLRTSIANLKRKFEISGDSANYFLMRTLLNMLEGYHAETGPDNYWFWSTVAESLENPRQVSFAPTIDLSDNDARRRFTSISKFLKKAGREHGSPFTDEQADQIGKIFGDNVPETRHLDIEVVRGDEIMDAYRELEVPGNCMQEKPYVRWYAENPGRVGLVKVMQSGDYVGRALIWTTDAGETVVDRCYSSSGAGDIVNALHKWCDENGYDYKTRQCYDDGYLKSDRLDHRVTLNRPTRNSYPYLDTFKYTSDDPGSSETITLETEGEGSECARFDCTEGSWSGGCSSNRVGCCDCGEVYHEDNIRWHGDDAYCEGCFDDNFTLLDYTAASGRRVRYEVHNDEVIHCDACLDVRLPEHVTEHDNRCYCDGCFQDRFTCCENCDSTIPVDDAITAGKGEPCCEDCVATCVHCCEPHMLCNECDCPDAVAGRDEAAQEAAAEEQAEIRAARDEGGADPVTPCAFTIPFQWVQYGAVVALVPPTLHTCDLL